MCPPGGGRIPNVPLPAGRETKHLYVPRGKKDTVHLSLLGKDPKPSLPAGEEESKAFLPRWGEGQIRPIPLWGGVRISRVSPGGKSKPDRSPQGQRGPGEILSFSSSLPGRRCIILLLGRGDEDWSSSHRPRRRMYIFLPGRDEKTVILPPGEKDDISIFLPGREEKSIILLPAGQEM